MHPDSWRSMSRAAARQHLNVPFRFTLSTRSHSSSPSSTIGVTFWPNPALFTRMSSRPCVCATSAKNASTAAVDVTSRRAAAAVSPSPARAPATASAFSRCRSAMITAAPLAARVSAMPRPSPCAAPVTTATCPESVCGDPAFGFKTLPPVTLRTSFRSQPVPIAAFEPLEEERAVTFIRMSLRDSDKMMALESTDDLACLTSRQRCPSPYLRLQGLDVDARLTRERRHVENLRQICQPVYGQHHIRLEVIKKNRFARIESLFQILAIGCVDTDPSSVA